MLHAPWHETGLVIVQCCVAATPVNFLRFMDLPICSVSSNSMPLILRRNRRTFATAEAVDQTFLSASYGRLGVAFIHVSECAGNAQLMTIAVTESPGGTECPA